MTTSPSQVASATHAAGEHDRRDVELSIVIPLYNEEENVPHLYDKLCGAIEQIGRSAEVILVNDGSKDRTGDLIDELADKDARIVAVNFRRNYGQTAAMSAGFKQATGKIIIPMDGDLQNDPADIRNLLAKLDEGYDVVSGWRKNRQDETIRVIPSKVANWLISRVSGVHLHDYGCSLKAYRREVLDGVELYGEMHRFIPIYAHWQGARITELPVTHHPRIHGKSKYGFERLIKVVLDLIVVKFFSAFMTKPIYLFGGIGVVSFILSFLAAALAIFFKVLPEHWGSAWHKDFSETPLPVVSIGMFVVGVQLILIGLLAEVMMRTYFESQQKTIYRVRSIRRRRSDTQE